MRQCHVLELTLEDSAENFWHRLITVDGTWISYYNPETKQQCKHWVEHGEKPPLRAKVVPSVDKVMITVFWDCEGIIYIEYLPQGDTINADTYVASLDAMHEELKTNDQESSINVYCFSMTMLDHM